MSDRTNTRKQDRIKELVGNFNSFESRRDHILFNYQFLTSGEEYGQSFEDWDRERIILDLNNKLKVFSGKKKVDLISEGVLCIYGAFPAKSKFKYPPSLPKDNGKAQWARLSITGRRRVIGFFTPGSDRESDVFYVVFLDEGHEFYPSEKKHT